MVWFLSPHAVLYLYSRRCCPASASCSAPPGIVPAAARCNLDVWSDFTAPVSVTHMQSLLCQTLLSCDLMYAAHRLILKMETVTVSGCKCSVAVCGRVGGCKPFKVHSSQDYLMWFSQAGRLLFSTSFVFSVEVHLMNVGPCQGPAHRLVHLKVLSAEKNKKLKVKVVLFEWALSQDLMLRSFFFLLFTGLGSETPIKLSNPRLLQKRALR